MLFFGLIYTNAAAIQGVQIMQNFPEAELYILSIYLIFYPEWRQLSALIPKILISHSSSTENIVVNWCKNVKRIS